MFDSTYSWVDTLRPTELQSKISLRIYKHPAPTELARHVGCV